MRLRAALLLLLLLPALTACGNSSDSDGSAGTTVVTSIYPLQFVAEQVAGDHADVVNLTSPGTEPHDLELSVSRTAEVLDADVLVYLRGFQPAVDDAVDQAADEGGDRVVVDAADPARLIPVSEDAHAHAEDESFQAAEKSDGDKDPHFWLDPTRLAAVASQVADALAEADPERADDYAQNAAALERRLLALDDEITEGLSDCTRDSVVVSHNAFQYWAIHYGLHMYAIAGLSPEAEPSPAHIAQLQQLIRSEGITTVFSETLASPKMAETLSSDLGLTTAVLDPIEGLSDSTADQDYFSLMRQDLAALQKANGCR